MCQPPTTSRTMSLRPVYNTNGHVDFGPHGKIRSGGPMPNVNPSLKALTEAACYGSQYMG